MKHIIQIELIERVLSLINNKTTHMVDSESKLPVEYYYSKERYERELELIFKHYPIIMDNA
jgi:hypothetical protein